MEEVPWVTFESALGLDVNSSRRELWRVKEASKGFSSFCANLKTVSFLISRKVRDLTHIICQLFKRLWSEKHEYQLFSDV